MIKKRYANFSRAFHPWNLDPKPNLASMYQATYLKVLVLLMPIEAAY